LLSDEEKRLVKANYPALRAKNKQMPFALGGRYDLDDVLMIEHNADERQAQLEKWWAVGGLAFMLAYSDIMLEPDTNFEVAEFVRRKIASTVKDPTVAGKLMPRTTLGSKRLSVGTDYYETYNRHNVSLIDINATPLECFTWAGIQTSGGEREYDAIVCATGFDAMTGALTNIDIRGVDGASLKKKWSQGTDTYLGLQVSGFPNLFIVAGGPGSPAVFTNVVKSIEHHVEWIAQCIAFMRASGKRTIEADPEAEADWVDHVQQVAKMTLFPQENSWYNGANVPGKTKLFLPYVAGFPAYTEKCEDVVRKGYEGFIFS
jgi:cyclohexanone monooxygenase